MRSTDQGPAGGGLPSAGAGGGRQPRPARQRSTIFRQQLQDEASAARFWKRFHAELAANHRLFSDSLGRHLQSDTLLHLLSLLLIPIIRNGFRDGRTKNRLFEIAQALGAHLLPVHYYSPIPNTFELPETAFSEPFAAFRDRCIDAEGQLRLIDTLARWSEELADVPTEQGSGVEFCWNNLAFGPLDALTYYGLIRELKPARVLEVGGGYSTMLAARAALKNGTTRVRCIEPHPMPAVRTGFAGLERTLRQPVQDVPLAEFERLGPGDILFVDSTHVSKIGSDVNFLVLRVLPRLAPGVVVHFHDIFLPDEYPRAWVEKNVFFNEQYLIMSFLLFNDAFEVLLLNHYLAGEHRDHLAGAFKRDFPLPPPVEPASLWMRRR